MTLPGSTLAQVPLISPILTCMTSFTELALSNALRFQNFRTMENLPRLYISITSSHGTQQINLITSVNCMSNASSMFLNTVCVHKGHISCIIAFLNNLSYFLYQQFQTKVNDWAWQHYANFWCLCLLQRRTVIGAYLARQKSHSSLKTDRSWSRRWFHFYQLWPD